MLNKFLYPSATVWIAAGARGSNVFSLNTGGQRDALPTSMDDRDTGQLVGLLYSTGLVETADAAEEAGVDPVLYLR